MPTTTRRSAPASVKLTAFVALAAFILPLAAHTAAAEPSPATADQLVVRYGRDTSAAQRSAVARAHGLTRLQASPDGRTEIVLAQGRSPAAVARRLAADPAIVAVAPNSRRELALDPRSEPGFAEQWGMDNTGQPLEVDPTHTAVGRTGVDIDGLQALRYGLGSPSVVVAVIDDGVDLSHPDLAARAWTNPGEAGALASNGIDDDGNGYIDDVNGWDFCNNDNTVHDAGHDGHGTHVAGTIAASLDGRGVVGVAPGIKIMALKFIDDSPDCGLDSMAVEAIDYAASFGVRILNASWGGPSPSTVLDAAIADSGALFVAAAGNDGANLDQAPTNFDPDPIRFYPAGSAVRNIISVAAIDQTGRLADFSNYGRVSVDLAAPGTNILSSWPQIEGCSGACYAWEDGTSMAAPHVSGVAALVGSERPALLADPIALRARLLSRARPMPATSGQTATGRMVNALRAIDFDAPLVTPPSRLGIPVGTIVGRTSTRANLRWEPARDIRTGIASYDIRRHSPAGWTRLASSTRATAIGTSLTFGTPYSFRLRAADLAGNLSGPADSTTFLATLLPDSTPAVSYSAGWSTTTITGATDGHSHSTTRSNAAMRLHFRGRSIAILARRGRTSGSARVYVDGAYVSTINLYRTTTTQRVVVFSRTWSTSAAHTVRIVVLATARHPRVDIDGFVVVR